MARLRLVQLNHSVQHKARQCLEAYFAGKNRPNSNRITESSENLKDPRSLCLFLVLLGFPVFFYMVVPSAVVVKRCRLWQLSHGFQKNCGLTAKFIHPHTS